MENKYSLVSIRNILGLSHLAVIDVIKSGYISVVGDGDTLDTYYTDIKGYAYLKRLVSDSDIGFVGVI